MQRAGAARTYALTCLFVTKCVFVLVHVLSPPMSYEWLCPNHSQLLLFTSSELSVYLNPSCVYVPRTVLFQFFDA